MTYYITDKQFKSQQGSDWSSCVTVRYDLDLLCNLFLILLNMSDEEGGDLEMTPPKKKVMKVYTTSLGDYCA